MIVSLEENIPDYDFFCSRKIDFAWIEITKSCPYKCRHCYNESDIEVDVKHMSMEDFYDTVAKLKRFGIRKIQLIGGEPTIHPNYKQMVIHSAKNFDDVEVFSNGVYINEALIEIYKKYNIHFAFSFYSDIEEEYEKVTGIKNSFKRITNTIKLLELNGIKHRLESVRMKGVQYSEQFLSDLQRKPDLPWLVGSASLELFDKEMLNEKYITKDKMRKLSKKIKSEEVISRMQYHNCFSRKIYIDYQLNCYPCVMERGLIHGNIRNKEIDEVIKKDIVLLAKEHVNGCSECEYRWICHDCRPDRADSCILDKPWYCLYMPEKGLWKEI